MEKIILGIDPGTNIMGYGLIKVIDGKAEMLSMGVIDLRKFADGYLKLGHIFERVTGIIDAYLPDEMAIEAPFFGKNVQSMLKLGRAQGTAIVGRNASGKTQYVEQMRRRLSSDTVRYIAFRDTYGPAVDGQYYLQLRWNQHDIDPEMPTVREALCRSKGNADPKPLLTSFGLEGSMDKHIITLSSGELRKFQLTKHERCHIHKSINTQTVEFFRMNCKFLL